MNKLKLECPHLPKIFKLTYSCKITGDYTLKVCEFCYKKEDRKFLISEDEMKNSKEVNSCLR